MPDVLVKNSIHQYKLPYCWTLFQLCIYRLKSKPNVVMKLFLSIAGLFMQINAFSQAVKDPIEVTIDLHKKLVQEIDYELPIRKQKLQSKGNNMVFIEFSVDTFKVERLIAKWIELDYSDIGMRSAISEATKLYDNLLNKYYKKLLFQLNEEDKKVLISAQKAWLSFRDNEIKLVETIAKEKYSGGGTSRLLTEDMAYFNLLKCRTIVLFEHYYGTMQVE
ncbi:lysozyme inhibitor LprI family protein [Flavihumibacter sp. CACIAM 22H1]|uniref:lysozyme inhibitor LprI family protein n=1 Tax=Flavihumibacter sp. CACIAM 22H1 TaxID=1812911 RepID=UPI0007A8FBC8|nr:lysozyme inhibitor LprI family protein [Flavihumibacter sp. CACIAM 22H1]KYP13542.1 MAG: hypothetical protein A1D16_17430 [Flavihumibacter sp. CACIAM 22H1]